MFTLRIPRPLIRPTRKNIVVSTIYIYFYHETNIMLIRDIFAVVVLSKLFQTSTFLKGRFHLYVVFFIMRLASLLHL